jgi:Xaa-Pro aminopeptidase
MSDYSIYAQRRAKLIEQMQAGVAVIPTATERVRNRDAHYPYRFDSYFYYLSGFTEPGAALVLMGGKKSRSILFCRDKDPEREVWDGYRCGPEGARERFGFDESHSLTKLDELMPKLLADQPALHYAMGTDEQWDARIVGWLNSVRSQSRSGVTAPAEIKDVRRILDEMRIIKGEHELALMRRAAQISTGAHCRAMRATRPGKKEFEIEAELIHEFRRHGAQAPAYMPIVAGGANACVLHYVENSATLKDGDLLLIDAGCELDGYASDITRTFPVNGRFRGPQKDVYQMVLAAQAAAIAAVKPGNAWDQPHDVALKVLAQGMIDLGLCKGSLDKVLESGDYKRFYMHRTGHWLGLDVHDAGDYKRDGKWRELKPGMVLTVEPGCYVRPAQDVPEKLWNIGVRIEDDVLITTKGQEVLTSAAPKKIEDIEKLMHADAA